MLPAIATPVILGIVNLTRDSFSDGGRFLDPANAIAEALRQSAAGADLIDLGPASSHPDGEVVPAAEQIRRLEPVVRDLVGRGLRVSVDSPEPVVQRWAIAHGVAMLNDIRGFPLPELYGELAGFGGQLVVMHAVEAGHRAARVNTSPATIWQRIESFFALRLLQLGEAGVAEHSLILDPGMGFFLGTDPEVSLEVLRGLERLKSRFGLPVLVSVSRKSFLGALTGRPVAERGAATLAAELMAILLGADYIRTHNVAALRDACRVWSALTDRQNPGAS